MKSLRIRIIILTCWLILLNVISKLLNPTTISNIAIFFIFILLITVLIFPRILRIQIWALTTISIITLLVIKFLSGGLSGDLAIFLAVIETCMIIITTFLCLLVSIALNEFENVVNNITLGQPEEKIKSSLMGEGSIYREVRRARNHQRPLALISIGVDEKSLKPTVEKMVQEIQRSMMRQYKLRELSKVLCNELEDCAVIVQDTDHYLAVLPDTSPEELPFVITRLRQKACDQVGIDLKIGSASLFNDSYTFDGLVERAIRDMKSDREPQPQPAVVKDTYPLERRST